MLLRSRRAMMGWALTLPFAAASAGPDQEVGDKEDRRQTVEALRKVHELGREVRRLGEWSVQADQIESFLDDLWERNGWNSESDQFAKRLNREVARIPPWRFKRRLDKMSELVAQRYQLGDQQRLRFEAQLFAESVGFIAGNADTILSHARDYIGRRLRGEPLSPDDVRRWTLESDPLVADLTDRVDRMSASMSRDMNADQRAKFERDLDSLHRQMEFVLQQRESWKRGEWKPEDWGLHNDPIQMGHPAAVDRAAAREPGQPVGRPRQPPQPGAVTSKLHRPFQAEDESTWAAYVRRFIARHQLDAAQREAIQSILAELEVRAALFRQRHAEQLAAVPEQERETAEVYQPLRSMFQELQQRAEALLTRSQQAADKAGGRG